MSDTVRASDVHLQIKCESNKKEAERCSGLVERGVHRINPAFAMFAGRLRQHRLNRWLTLGGDIRDRMQSEWSFAIFVVDSLNDLDGKFSDGYFGYAYLGGPFLVMTYDNNGCGIHNSHYVASRTKSAIFWAPLTNTLNSTAHTRRGRAPFYATWGAMKEIITAEERKNLLKDNRGECVWLLCFPCSK